VRIEVQPIEESGDEPLFWQVVFETSLFTVFVIRTITTVFESMSDSRRPADAAVSVG